MEAPTLVVLTVVFLAAVVFALTYGMWLHHNTVLPNVNVTRIRGEIACFGNGTSSWVEMVLVNLDRRVHEYSVYQPASWPKPLAEGVVGPLSVETFNLSVNAQRPKGYSGCLGPGDVVDVLRGEKEVEGTISYYEPGNPCSLGVLQHGVAGALVLVASQGGALNLTINSMRVEVSDGLKVDGQMLNTKWPVVVEADTGKINVSGTLYPPSPPYNYTLTYAPAFPITISYEYVKKVPRSVRGCCGPQCCGIRWTDTYSYSYKYTIDIVSLGYTYHYKYRYRYWDGKYTCGCDSDGRCSCVCSGYCWWRYGSKTTTYSGTLDIVSSTTISMPSDPKVVYAVDVRGVSRVYVRGKGVISLEGDGAEKDLLLVSRDYILRLEYFGNGSLRITSYYLVYSTTVGVGSENVRFNKTGGLCTRECESILFRFEPRDLGIERFGAFRDDKLYVKTLPYSVVCVDTSIYRVCGMADASGIARLDVPLVRTTGSVDVVSTPLELPQLPLLVTVKDRGVGGVLGVNSLRIGWRLLKPVYSGYGSGTLELVANATYIVEFRLGDGGYVEIGPVTLTADEVYVGGDRLHGCSTNRVSIYGRNILVCSRLVKAPPKIRISYSNAYVEVWETC